MNQIAYYPYHEESLQDQAKRISTDLDLDPVRIGELVTRLIKDHDETPYVDLYRKIELTVFYLGTSKALDMYQKGDIKKIFRRQSFIESILDNRFSFYHMKDITDQLESFSSYLERNKTRIIKTGFPQYDFEGSSFFDLELAYLYFVKLPIDINKFLDESGGIEFHYKWGRRGAGANHPQLSSKRKISPLGRGYAYKDDGRIYTAHGEPIALCDYEEADLMDGLSPEDAHRLERSREKLFDLKLRIIKELINQIHSGSHQKIWQHCLKIFKEHLSAEDAQFYLRMDVEYTGWDLQSGERKLFRGDDIRPGGLTDILYFIGFCQRILSTHTSPEIVELSRHIRTDSYGQRYLERGSYYDLCKDGQENIIDSAMELFKALEFDADNFWNSFREQIVDDFENHLKGHLKIPVKWKNRTIFQKTFEPLVKFAEEAYEATGVLPEITFSQNGPSHIPKLTQSQSSSHIISEIASMEALKWKEVEITFTSDDSIRIKARHFAKRYTFAEIGFKDKRKGDFPDTCWKLLRIFAGENGEISWDTNISGKERDSLKHMVSRIRKRLKLIFNIEDDPFYNYRRFKAYKTKFSIGDDRF